MKTVEFKAEIHLDIKQEELQPFARELDELIKKYKVYDYDDRSDG